jgi:hypothetical protein
MIAGVMKKKQLYIFTAIASVAGLAWVSANILAPARMDSVPGCFFRKFTGIPCPSCGATHSVLKVIHLDWVGAFYDNPVGFILAVGLLVVPCMLLYDVALGKNAFYLFYKGMETVVRKRWVAICLITLVIANWAWNIYKYTT